MSDTFYATLTVARDDSLFDGHFPGRPILPGVAQLGLLVTSLAPRIGPGAALHGVRSLRLRQLVKPGDSLELTARRLGDDEVRCALARGGVLVSNGVLRIATAPLPPSPASGFPAHDRDVEHELRAPPLPQQPPMRVPTERLRYSARGLQCEARIPPGWGFVKNGQAPAYSCIELAAQCAAAWEALGRARAGGRAGPRAGYLVGMRDVELFARDVPADRTMTASIALQEAAASLSRYGIEVTIDSRVVVRGRIDAVLAKPDAL